MLQDSLNSSRSRSGRWVLFSLLSLAVSWYLVLSVAVYGGWWQGTKTVRVLRITPLPVAIVGWRPLSYAEYLDQRQAVIHYSRHAAQTSNDRSVTTVDQAAQLALTKMVRLAESEQLIRQLHVQVTAADINQA